MHDLVTQSANSIALSKTLERVGKEHKAEIDTMHHRLQDLSGELSSEVGRHTITKEELATVRQGLAACSSRLEEMERQHEIERASASAEVKRLQGVLV